MVNVTYVEDTLIATVVVSAYPDSLLNPGDTTILVDIGKSLRENLLEPIKIEKEAAAVFGGLRSVERFAGYGVNGNDHSPKKRFISYSNGEVKLRQNVQSGIRWTKGQFLMFGENNFSFSWWPYVRHAYFGRPPPEMVLSLLGQEYKIQDRRTALNNRFRAEDEEAERDTLALGNIL